MTMGKHVRAQSAEPRAEVPQLPLGGGRATRVRWIFTKELRFHWLPALPHSLHVVHVLLVQQKKELQKESKIE
jgi:hypothetical protein